MSFTEIEFALFLPAVFALYWLGPRNKSYQNAILLLASYFFFGSWHWQLLGLIFAGTIIDYLISNKLAALRASDDPRRQLPRVLLATSLTVSIGTLAFFKYAGFFATSANDLFSALGIPVSMPVLQLLLPLGVSYWTLQRVGYMLDVYWGRQQPTTSLLDFALFCCFFGQVTAGPIARGSELMPQISAVRQISAKWIADGAFAFLLGYVLKAWAADAIGPGLVNPVFSAPGDYNAVSLWLGALGFAAQVFGDFAGYSLMAIGVARLFAIELPMNFRTPFLSRSLPEFWRRWHITLNRWLFDYIFTPLTTSSGWFRGRLDVALMLVFLASGLWHGAAWTFVLWGLLHGIGMVVHRNWDVFYRGLCRRDRVWVARRKTWLYALAAWFLTFVFFVLTLVPFRSANLDATLTYAHGMFTGAGSTQIGLSVFVLGGFIFIIGHHLLELNLFTRVRNLFFSAPAFTRGLAYGAVIAFLVLTVPLSPSAFIYQQF